MNNAIAADVTVIDIDGDRFADRMYVGDMGGRVWRFDIHSGNPRATLVTGGVIARLGAGDVSNPAIAQTRRFYNRADVALIQERGRNPYFNIAIGSGYRGHPLHKATTERFYALRDKSPFVKRAQGGANGYDALGASAFTDASSGIVDITNTPDIPVSGDADGWRIDLVAGGVRTGEKVLAESITVNGAILFSSYQPPAGTVQPCDPQPFGRSRVYALQVDSGLAALDWDEDGEVDRFTDVASSGIPPAVMITLEDADVGDGGGGSGNSRCFLGPNGLPQCVRIQGRQRTYWERPAN
jgi:type IV pilus assembly protein PilY1